MCAEAPKNHITIYAAGNTVPSRKERKMKANLMKILALVLACLMIAVMAAGCSSGTKDDGKDTKAPVNTAEPKDTEDGGDDTEPADTKGGDEPTPGTGDSLYGLGGLVVYEDDNCMFRIDSVTEDDFWESKLFNVTLQNKTADKELGFSIGDVCVNGCMLSTLFLETVKAGETIQADFDLAIGDRTGDPQEIIMDLTVSDYNDFFGDPIVKDTFTIYTDGYDASNVKYADRETTANEKVVVDTDEYTVIVLGVDESWGFTLEMYYENKTDKDVMFNVDEVKINGEDVTAYSGTDVTAGHFGYESVSFTSDNDDLNPESFEFTLKVSDADQLWGDPFFTQECTYEP